MIHNEVIDTMMKRRSVRKYTDQQPNDEVIETIVRAGQQAPFAYQLCSVILTRKRKLPWGAPLMFTICVDMHRFEQIMAKRGWKTKTSDLSIILFGLQDATLMAENMVIAAESLGLGSCFIGAAAYTADRFQKTYKLPKRVYPFVHLVMGYPAEEFPPRPRYPLEFTLFAFITEVIVQHGCPRVAPGRGDEPGERAVQRGGAPAVLLSRTRGRTRPR